MRTLANCSHPCALPRAHDRSNIASAPGSFFSTPSPHMWTTPSSAHASPSPSVQAFLYALAASGRAGDRRSHARTAGALDA